MTNERDLPIVDESLRRQYRELAGERTPEHLNASILAQAGKAATPGYGRFRAWTRPLAWAATIALSVALVLELSRTSDPATSAPFETRAPAAPAQSGRTEPSAGAGGTGTAPALEFEDRDMDLLRRASEMADVTSGNNPQVGAANAELAGCNAPTRDDPDAWLTCILALEASGRMEAAANERRLLQAAHPDIELPPPLVANE